MELEIIILSKINQSQKYSCHVISHVKLGGKKKDDMKVGRKLLEKRERIKVSEHRREGRIMG
jgi:hypothetical protein